MLRAGVVVMLLLSMAAGACAPSVDVERERTALLDADQAWSQTPPDVEKFVSFFVPDASFLPPDMPIAQGTDAIRKVTSTLVALPGFSIKWAPSKADVAGSGDLGYTQGTYALTVNDPSGAPMTTVGKYVTMWRKQADGSWKVVADIFNADTPPPAPAPAAPPAPPSR